VYLVEGGLGAFVGAAFAFYFDNTQIPVVLDKLNLYNTFGLKPVTDEFYPLSASGDTSSSALTPAA